MRSLQEQEMAGRLRGACNYMVADGGPALRMARRLPSARGARGVAKQQGLTRTSWGVRARAHHQGVPEAVSRRLCHGPVPGVRDHVPSSHGVLRVPIHTQCDVQGPTKGLGPACLEDSSPYLQRQRALPRGTQRMG